MNLLGLPYLFFLGNLIKKKVYPADTCRRVVAVPPQGLLDIVFYKNNNTWVQLLFFVPVFQKCFMFPRFIDGLSVSCFHGHQGYICLFVFYAVSLLFLFVLLMFQNILISLVRPVMMQ